MAAYGHVARPVASDAGALRPRVYALPERAQTAERSAVVCIPFVAYGVTSQQAYEAADGAQPLQAPDALVELLHGIFNEELERGVTYPQSGPLSLDEFRAYFLGYDLIVAFFLPASACTAASLPSPLPTTGAPAALSSLGLDVFSLNYAEALAGCYYIKPNYPARSAHICNAGFVVPPSRRGLGLGAVLGQSFLHFGPTAGYRASVFNLVYANNFASIRIWDRLGFTRVGKIPNAGLFKRADGQGEEFVDAWIIHKDLISQEPHGDGGEAIKDGSAPAA